MPNGITTDELNIVIKVDNSGAVKGLNEVKTALKDLDFDARNTGKLTEISNAFSAIGRAASELSGINLPNIGAGISQLFSSIREAASEDLAKNAERVGKAFTILTAPVASFVEHTTGLSLTAAGLRDLNGAIEQFGSGPDIEQIRAMKEPMRELGKAVAGVSGTGNNVNALKDGIAGMTDAVKDFKLTAEDTDKLQAPFGALSGVLDKFAKDAKPGATSLQQLASSINTLNKVGFDANFENNLKDAADGISMFVNRVQNSLHVWTANNFANLTGSISKALSSIRAFNKLGSDANLEKNVMATANAVSVFVSQLNRIPEEAIARMERLGAAIRDMKHINAASRSMNSYANASKKTHRAMSHMHKQSKALTKSLKKLGKQMLKLMFLPVTNVLKSVKRFGDSFKRLGGVIKRLALYRFLRTMIRAVVQQVKLGIDALYAWSDAVGYRFNGAMDGLATSFRYLRNSVAAMISPLVEYVQPIIDVLVDKIVEFLNLLNQFVATVTGKSTWVRAIKGAATYADETGRAAAAQEELNRTVLGFDELNKLDDNDDRGRGYGSDADAGGGEFEELPITASFNDINFKDLGKKLSDGIAGALNGIDWNTIQKKARELVRKTVDFVNGFFGNKEMWDAVGRTVAGGINTATTAITTWTDGVEWETIGANIASSFKTAVGQIQWEDLGKSISASVKIFAKLFHGFVSSMQPDDWKTLGESIGNAVNAALKDIPWDTLIPDLFSFATGMLQALVSAIGRIDWDELKQQITDGLKGVDWQGVVDALKDLWNSLPTVLKVVAVFEASKALSNIGLFKNAFTGSGGLLSVIGTAMTSMGGWAKIILLVSGLLVGLGYILKNDINEYVGTTKDETMRATEELQKMYDEGKLSWSEYSTFIGRLTHGTRDDVQQTCDDIHREYAAAFDTGEKFFDGKSGTFGKLGQKINNNFRNNLLFNDFGKKEAGKKVSDLMKGMERGVKNNRAAIQTATGEVVADFTGIRLPDKTAESTKFTKSIANGITNNKRAIKIGIDEVVADFTGVKIPDKTSEGAKLPKSLTTGIDGSKPELVNSIKSLKGYFTGFTSPDKTAEGAKLTKTLNDGVNRNKPTLASTVNSVLAGFRNLTVPDKTSEGAKLPKTLVAGINGMKPSLSSNIKGLSDKFTNFEVADKKAAGSSFVTSLAAGVSSGKSAVATAIDGVAGKFKLLNPNDSNSPLKSAQSWGSVVTTSFSKGVGSSSGLTDMKTAVNAITGKILPLNPNRDDSPFYPYTWGTHLAQNFADGLSSSTSKNKIAQAASTIAAKAREYLAFSKPDIGPLSDADMYGPDFMKLYAQGIEQSKWRVMEQVHGLANDIDAAIPSVQTTYTLNNEPTGLDSLAQAITNSDTPINVYIGNDKLDTVIARSNSRMNYRSGGRY